MRQTLTSRAAIAGTVAVFAAVAGMLLPSVASAQGLIFDWGGDTVSDSGKSHIKFNGSAKPGDIIVSFGDRTLYFFTAPGEADTYPIAIPRDQSRWEGVTTISQKRENPSWTPTPHMMAENPKLPRWVPGGHPMNPLGIRALYLGSSDYRIHGTDAPWTIGTAASKGCVRMFNKDVVDLYPRVKVGSKVTVTWQKFDSNTLAMAQHATAVSDPDPDHGYVANAKTVAYSQDDDNDAPKPSKAKRHKAEDDSVSAPQKDRPAADEATAARSTDDTAKAADTSGDAKSAVETPVREHKPHRAAAQKDKPVTDEAAAPSVKSSDETSKAANAASDANLAADSPAREHKSHRAAKPSTHLETGSIAANDKTGDDSALDVAQRAMAAAERAAAAAERAAAAAERAAAVTQHQAGNNPAASSDGAVVSAH